MGRLRRRRVQGLQEGSRQNPDATQLCMRPCREFQQGDKIAFSGQEKVPVIIDKNADGKWVNDSWAIAKYLESAYPDRPSLFGGPAGQHLLVIFQTHQK